MKPSDRDLVTLGPWPRGIDNVSAEHAVKPGSLREAVNVNLDDDGRLSRRDGYEKLFEENEPHSLFAYGRRAFYAAADTLKQIEFFDNGEPGDPIDVYEGINRDAPLAHVMIEPDIFVSDGVINLRIDGASNVTLWSLPTAPRPDAVLNTGTGALEAGRYSISIAYRSATGEEGPLGPAIDVTVEEGSIELSFPAAPAGVARQLVFLTKPNGTAPLLYGSLPAAATMAVVSQNRLGRSPVAAGLDPMPAGHFATYFAGRLLVGYEAVLYWSEPNQYSYTALDYNYIMLAERITGLGTAGETTTGVFVGQETRTFFLRGDNPADAKLEECYPAGVVPGSMTLIPGARLGLENPPAMPLPAWLATNGVFCVGLPDGSVLPLTETRYAAAVGTRAAATFLPREGRNQLLVTTQNPSENNFAISDSVSFEIIRNGITL